MGSAEQVVTVVEPVLSRAGLELVDCELKPGLLRVVVDAPGGVDADRLGQVSAAVSRALDAEDPIPGRYTLEVSSPGLERPLRTPEHYRRAVGTEVAVRTRPDVEGERRIQGTLDAADDAGITVAGRRLTYDQIDRARTVFQWGPPPKPGTKKRAS